LLSIPLVQEMNEWFPSFRESKFVHWLYRKPIFAMATGVLVISKPIERRVQELSAVANPRLSIHLLPSMVDSDRFVAAAQSQEDAMETVPHFLWCGVGYTGDVLFLIRVLAMVNREGYRCRLRMICAGFLDWKPETMLDYAAEQGLPCDAVHFLVGLDDLTLASCYKSAAAHLLPMWDDEKSRTRLPNKLAEYLASGRPVITSAVGDLQDFLVDDVNAYIGAPGSERDFADNMISVLQDPDRADRIGAAGQRTCIDRMDYRFQIDSLSKFFVRCIDDRKAAKSASQTA
jgi:glycosyltransferase involved in cell wall biosynthesis